MHGFINKPLSRLTNEPKFDSILQDEVPYGTFIQVISSKNGFYYVKTYYNYEGYISHNDVTLNISFNTNAIITKNFVDILKEPKYQSNSLISIPKGSYINIRDEEEINGFIPIKLLDNEIGYIRKENFKKRKQLDKKTNEDYLRNKIINNALSYLNTQYRWGGKTVLGIDCSGLTSISYLLEEIIIYRDTNINDEIMKLFDMKYITKEELKPGDLIYMPGHVMIYLSKDKYIHSAGSLGGVTISSLNPKDSNYKDYDINTMQFVSVF